MFRGRFCEVPRFGQRQGARHSHGRQGITAEIFVNSLRIAMEAAPRRCVQTFSRKEAGTGAARSKAGGEWKDPIDVQICVVCTVTPQSYCDIAWPASSSRITVLRPNGKPGFAASARSLIFHASIGTLELRAQRSADIAGLFLTS